MEDLYATYKDHIEFVIVYIREAHPEMLRKGNETGIEGRPASIDERVILATECVSKFAFTIPMVIDGMDGTVNDDYQAMPVRVTVTDVDGKVAYYAGRGPFDFNLLKVEKVLKKLVANNGLLPPVPEAKWGESIEGIRCGLSIDPPELKAGDDITIHLSFENTTEETIHFYYEPDKILQHLVVKNRAGKVVDVEAAPDTSFFARMKKMRRRSSRIRPNEIAPGAVYKKLIDATIASVPFKGKFDAVFNFVVDNADLPENIWQGKGTSGVFMVQMKEAGKAPAKESATPGG